MKHRKDIKNTEKVEVRLENRKLLCTKICTEIVTIFEVKVDAELGTEKNVRIVSQEQVNTEEKIVWIRELREVSEKELQQLRESSKPGFVLKKNGKYWYTQITVEDHVGNYNLMEVEHLCVARDGSFCGRFYPAPEEKGGCSKVWGHPRCIEKYPFIKVGYESFNTTANAMVVVECDNFLTSPKKHDEELTTLSEDDKLATLCLL